MEAIIFLTVSALLIAGSMIIKKNPKEIYLKQWKEIEDEVPRYIVYGVYVIFILFLIALNFAGHTGPT